MIKLQEALKFRVESEEEAAKAIDLFKKKSNEEGYTLKKSGCQYKTKKAKGEIIEEWYLVDIVKVFNEEV